MRKLYLGCFAVLTMLVIGCGESKGISPEQQQHQIKESEEASKAYSAAVKLAENNDPAGFLKLYEIATKDQIYTVEYSEVAKEKLFLLLYAKPKLWIKIFSQVDLDKFKLSIKSIGVSQFPEGVTSDEQYLDSIFSRLEKIKGDKKEMELIDYIFGLYNHKRH